MRIALGVDQLGIDPDLVSRPTDAAFQHIAHTEITTVPGMFDRSLVRSSVRPSAKYCWSRSSLRLTNGSTTIERRGAVVGIAGADADAVTLGGTCDNGHCHHTPPA